MSENAILHLGLLGLLLVGLFGISWILQKGRIPTILGFMVSGLLAQFLPLPWLHEFFPLIGEIAIWLLFFFVGLEYSPEYLSQLGRNILWPALIDLGINFGAITGIALFFSPPLEAIILGSALYPSSTAVVARLFLDYSRLATAEAELLLGLLIFEDIVGVGLLGIFTPLVGGKALSWLFLAKLLFSLIAISMVFWLTHKRLIPWITTRISYSTENSLEVFLMLGLVLGVGSLGHILSLSGALTAFLLGVLIPRESTLHLAAERNLGPIRELSIGFFFFSLSYQVGLGRLPVGEGIGWAILAVLLKGLSTFWAARAWGLKKRAAFRAALSFLPKGEFSLLFGALSQVWREVVWVIVLFSTVVGCVAFAKAGEVAERFFPRRNA